MTWRRHASIQILCWLYLAIGCGSAVQNDSPLRCNRNSARATIIGGQAMDAASFAATGALFVRQPKNEATFEYACTATLIQNDLLVTAAHCQNTEIPANVCETAAGACYLFCQQAVLPADLQPHTAQALGCTPAHRFVPHPKYHLPSLDAVGLQNDVFDLAVVILDVPITQITPAMLGPTAHLPENSEVHLVGYGYEQDPWQSFQLTKYVRKNYAKSLLGKTTHHEMHVGNGPNQPHKAFGDSGGPTFLQTPDGMQLVGITSRMYDLWDPNAGNIDSRIDSEDPWLQGFWTPSKSYKIQRQVARQ